MMPERRLAALLNDARQRQARECLYHTGSQPVSLLAPYHCCDRDQFPVRIVKELRDHQDEIWHVAYSPRATYFASAARDGEIIVYNTARWEIKNRLHARALRMGSQAAGVSHIAFSADEELLLSCQQDNAVCVWDLRTGLLLNQISHLHKEPPSAAVFVPQADPGPQRFLTGGLDKKIHLLSSTGEVLTTWDSGRIYDLKCTPDGRSFATIDTAGQLSVFDLQSLSMVHSLHIQDGELTSLAISADSQRLLVHCKPPDTKGELRKARLMEYSIPDCDLVHTFVNGPIQSQFIVRSGYGGNEEQFVLSGSEYGRVFIWHRTSRTLLESIEGHAQCVGSVSWRPGAMAEWASGSDDGTVKIWGVQREETNAQSDTGHE
jgi:WD40 repeat protein